MMFINSRSSGGVSQKNAEVLSFCQYGLVRFCYGLSVRVYSFPGSGENHPNLKSVWDLDPNKLECTTSYWEDETNQTNVFGICVPDHRLCN